MKLTIENIAPYLPYGLKAMKLAADIPYMVEITGAVKDREIQEYLFYSQKLSKEVGNYEIKLFKPILRKLDLTKKIKIDGVEVVPLIELYKLSNETNYNKKLDCEFIESWGAGKILKVFKDRAKDIYTEFIYCNGSFRKDTRYCSGSDVFGFNLDTPIRCNDKIHNQLQLFQWLYKNKFDLGGLIEKGLAVDASTFDINPYDN